MQRHESVVIDPEFLEGMDGNTIPVDVTGEVRAAMDARGAAADRAAAQERNRIAERLRKRSVAMAPGMLADLIEAGAL